MRRVEKRKPSWWECRLTLPLWRIVWQFIEKLKLELPYDTATPLLDTNPEKTIIQKDTRSSPTRGKKKKKKRHAHSNVHCSTVYNSQVMSINQ